MLINGNEYKICAYADLRGADLRGADLSCADLRRACLRDADLTDADLRGADLRGADLHGACLRDADLRSADLSGADLSCANLRRACLRGACLRDADLRGADLSRADLSCADLRGADLSRADLRGADLHRADLRGANLRETVAMPQCPEKGPFIAWKKAGKFIVKLEIPADAKRSSATSAKCRASAAKTIEIQNPDGTQAEVTQVVSERGGIYEVGKMTYPDSFDEDRWNECSNGIHVFIDRENAVNY